MAARRASWCVELEAASSSNGELKLDALANFNQLVGLVTWSWDPRFPLTHARSGFPTVELRFLGAQQQTLNCLRDTSSSSTGQHSFPSVILLI